MSNILTNNINPRSGNLITIGGVNDRVSIAGTLTYEDVSNIDSVGVITARAGVNVTGGNVTIDAFSNTANNYLSFRNAFAPSDTGGMGIMGADHSGANADGLAVYGYDGISFLTNQTERARIDNSGRLLVGITTARGDFYNASTIFPFVQVQGTGNERIVSITAVDTGSASGGSLVLAKSRSTGNTIVQNGDTLGALQFQGSDGTEIVDGAQIKTQVDGTPGANSMPGRLMFSTTANGASSTTERMRIDNAGRVTLKNGGSNYASEFQSAANQFVITNNGACGLTIDATSSTNCSIHFADGTTGDESYRGFFVYNNADDSLRIGTAGDEAARIDSSGRLLVGTTSSVDSSAKTQIVGDDSVRHLALKYTGTTGGAEQQIKWLDKNNQVNAAIGSNLQNDNPGTAAADLIFRTASGGTLYERMRIDSEGSFFNFSTNHGIYTQSSVGAGTLKYLYRGSNSSGSNIVFNVWSNGNVESATNSFGPVSDLKLKENIVDAGSQWNDFKSVQFRKFNFKEETGYETHTQLGVIAQELEAISPGLIYETPDTDAEGNEIGTTTKKVKASVLTMKALVALQEAMEKIETLEQRLTDAGL